MNPPPITDPVLGELTWDEMPKRWHGLVWLTPKHAVWIALEDREMPMDDYLAVCRTAYTRIRNNEYAHRLAVTQDMLDLYNNIWRDEDAAEETEQSFTRKLTLDSILLDHDGSATLAYTDEIGFFAGHTICADLWPNGTFHFAYLEPV